MSADTATPTTWASLRKSDGTPTEFRFDWYDDHSSWRLEEMTGSIAEARSILERAGVAITAEINHINDVTPIVNHLRCVHRNEAVTDADVRRALTLADELHVHSEVESDDANFEHDCLMDNIKELLGAWDDAHTWIFTDDDWDISSAIGVLDRLRNNRNGLGDNWTIRVSDGLVELPGETVHGIVADKEMVRFFEDVTETPGDCTEPGLIAPALMTVPEDDRPAVVSLTEALYGYGGLDYITPAMVNAIVATVARYDERGRQVVTEIANGLAENWTGSRSDLLTAAEALHNEPVCV